MSRCSLESPRQGDSNEYQRHMFLWRNKQNYPLIITKYPPYLFYCYHAVKGPKDAGGMANSVEEVWFGSTLFAQAHLSKYLGSFW